LICDQWGREGPFFALSRYAGQAHTDSHKQLKTGTRFKFQGYPQITQIFADKKKSKKFRVQGFKTSGLSAED
jgi:hypothetical protein